MVEELTCTIRHLDPSLHIRQVPVTQRGSHLFRTDGDSQHVAAAGIQQESRHLRHRREYSSLDQRVKKTQLTNSHPQAGLIYYIGQLTYNIFFHPLASYPGPLLWRASRLPYCVSSIRGTIPFDVHALFEKYGPVVRVAPNELAYADADAWKEILGHNPKGEENGKFQGFYRPSDDMPQDLISADRELHGKLRRQLAHGFSDRSMREQEPIIKGYIDMLMKRLRENCLGGKEALDIVAWYNFTTFDVSSREN